MKAPEKFVAASARVDHAAIAPLPRSRKIYVQGSRADLRVPMREIAQSDTPAGMGAALFAVGFGIGTGGGAHAPNEWYLIDSKDPKKIAGLDEATMFYVDYLYELAETAKTAR